MRTPLTLFAWILLLVTSTTALSQPCTLGGVYKIGPTGNYPTLTAALDSLRANGLSNNVVLELQSTYTSAGELFPLRFKNIPCIDSLKSVTIRPEPGATTRTISSNIPVVTIDLDSARFIKFDGRPGGVGTTSALTISNTSTNGSTIRFRNDASWNSFEYINIIGVNNFSGVVIFGTSTADVTNGNSFNKFISCNISKGSTTPVNCFYSIGSNNKKNGFNEIVNCNISDFYSSSSSTNGIYLGANNTNWKISGNSIYHSTQLNFTYSVVKAIHIDDTTSSGFLIENNFIGGSAPNCGSSRIVYGSWYNSIYLMTNGPEYTSVQGNTITNIQINVDISAGTKSGITLGMGKFKCGDIAGNRIGSDTAYNSINIAIINATSQFHGIVTGTDDQTYPGADTCYIKNNKISGINCYQPSPNGNGVSVIAISSNFQKKGIVDISNNHVGAPGSNVGINSNAYVIGIYSAIHSSVPLNLQPKNIISNNTIVNLYQSPTGIQITSGRNKVLNNTIRNLHATGGAVRGIFAQSGNDSTLISGNSVHSLTSTSTSANTIIGIDVQNSPGCTISKNFIHSFQSVTASGNDLTGLNVVSVGSLKILNNMVRLGIDTLGNPVATNQKIFGVYLQVDSSLFANNSIYVGGGGFNQTAALMLPATNPGRLVNNIIVNNRSAISGSTNNQYAIRMDNVNTVTKYFNNNIYHATGTRGYLGFYKGVAYSTMINWRGGVKADSLSVYYNPGFANPLGSAINVNLHIGAPTPAEGQGVLLTEVIDDIDGELRIGLSPTDIGADAGNFVYQDGDAPFLSHDAFLGQPVVSSFIYTLKVTDVGSAVDTNGANKPKMWFRKKYSSVSSWSNSPGDLISGNAANGTWGFRPDFSTLALAPGDSVEYYFVAQDLGLIPNVGYSNLAGTSHSNVNSQTSAPTTPLRLLIYGIFPDTIYIGTGQMYTSLTNAGGYFQATQINMVDTTKSNVEVIITSDLSETATYAYTPLHRANGPAITFRTNTPTLKNIHSADGGQNQSLIRMFNTSDMTIDGRVNGTGRYLKFSNRITFTAWAGACLEIGVGFKKFTVTNLILENNGGPPQSSNAVLYLLGQGGAPGPTVVRIENNIIRHAEGGNNLPMTGMSVSATGRDSTIIRNNEISNFRVWGLYMNGSGVLLDRAIIIDSNHFYYTDPISASGSMRMMDINSFNANYFIKNNFIGGTGPNCSGGPLLFATSSSGAEFYGVYLNVGADRTISIQNNTIKNIRFTQFGYNVYGMYVNSVKANIGDEQGNIIGDVSDPLSFTNRQTITGIAAIASGTAQSRIENNIIGGLEGTAVVGLNVDAINGRVANNKVANSRVYTNASFGVPGLTGITCSLGGGLVERNDVSNIYTLTDFSNATGMGVGAKTQSLSHNITVARNKIADVRIQSTFTNAFVTGLSCTNGEFIHNNQISIDNGSNVTPVKVTGLNITGGTNAANSRVYYNSIRVGGTASASNANHSYALIVSSGGPLANFKNNILYNERIGGTGRHFAYGDKSTGTISWSPGANPDNNLYVTRDTVALNEWRGTGAVAMPQWRTLVAGDTASYRKYVSEVPADSLFISASNGNLNINTLSTKSWTVNGKGMPIASISGDYDSSANVRSTSVATGATDIGADEFNTNTIPPVMRVSGNHNPGGTEFFEVEGRIVASITWGPGGTLPTLDPTRFYSGTWPNDTTNNNTVSGARYMNSYWDIPATGGSNYSYDLTLYFDSSMLGKVTNANTMLVNKRQSGTPGSWMVIHPTIVNTSLKRITINNQTSFSEFTATDSLGTFVSGSPLADLVITNPSTVPASIATGNNFTAQFTAINQGTASAEIHQVNFYLSADNILTPGSNGDALLGFYAITNIIAAGSNTGLLTKDLTIPCTIVAGNYYLFFVADGTNTVFESNETNNNVPLSITITPGISVPNTPGTISGNNIVCAGTSQTYSVDAVTGATSYTWTLPSGWTGTSTTNSITATTGSTGGNILVKANNSCGSSADQTLPVTVNTTPAQPGTISGNSSVCQGSSQTYSISAVTGATSYTWTLPSGWTGTSTTNSITVTTGSTGGNILVKANNNCGSSADQTLSVTVITTPSQPGAIGGNNSVCQGSSQTYSITAVAAATSYTWTLPSGWTGTSTTNSITITVGNTGGNILVKANNSCGSSADQTLSVTVNTTPAQPGTISGNNSVCQGSSQTYSIDAVAGATSYTWTLPSGWTGTSTTNSITTTVGSTSGTISVKANNNCGSSGDQTLAVTVSAIPAQPDTISGNNSVCQGSSQTYSITAVAGATSYTWTLPSGWTGTSTTNSISVTVGNTSGTISVKANNNCGSSADQTLTVTVSTIPAQPGTISGNNSVCQGSTQTYSVAAVAGATSYTWTLVSGGTGTSTTNSITVTVGSTSGTISVKANNNCGSSADQTLALVVNPLPVQPATITGNSNVLLAQTENYSITSLPAATSYNWQVSGGGTIQSGQGTNSVSINWTAAGTFNVTVHGINSCGNGPVQILPVTVSVGTGIYNPDNIYEIRINPNPSEGEFYLKAKGVSGKTIHISILNNLGQLIYASEQTSYLNEFTQRLDLKKMSSGPYYLLLKIGNKTYSRKILKKN